MRIAVRVSRLESSRAVTPSSRVRYGFVGQRFFRNLVFHYAVTVPFYLSCHMTLVEISLIDSAYWVCRASLDLPVGYLADTIGTKKALLIGTVTTAVAYLALSRGETFWWFIATNSCLAIGHSLSVGTDSALARGVLEDHGAGAEYPRTESRGALARNLALGLSMSVGAVVAARIAFRVSILLSGLLVMPAVLCVFLIPPRTPPRRTSPGGALRDLIRIHDRFLGLCGRLVIYTVFVMTEFTGNFLIQVILKTQHVDVAWAGVSFAGTLLVAAGAAALVPAITRLRSDRCLAIMVTLISLYFLSECLGLSVSGRGGLAISFLGFAIYGVVRGIYHPIFRTWIGNSVDSSIRATAFAAASVLGALTVGGLSPAFAWFIQRFGVGPLMLVCGVGSPLVVLAASLMSRRASRGWTIGGAA